MIRYEFIVIIGFHISIFVAVLCKAVPAEQLHSFPKKNSLSITTLENYIWLHCEYFISWKQIPSSIRFILCSALPAEQLRVKKKCNSFSFFEENCYTFRYSIKCCNRVMTYIAQLCILQDFSVQLCLQNSFELKKNLQFFFFFWRKLLHFSLFNKML